MNFNVENNTITISGNMVTFENNITKVIEINDLLIVLLNNPNSNRNIDQPDNNIYALNINSDIVWRIDSIINKRAKYDNMYMDGGLLVVIDFIGIHSKIDVIEKTIISRKGYTFS